MVYKRGMMLLALGCVFLLLVSCGKPAVEPVTDGFRCTVRLVYGSSEYIGTLDRSDPTTGSLTIHKPASLEGTTMTWDGDDVTVSYKHMTVTFAEGTLPVGAAVKALWKTLDSCRSSSENTTVVEGMVDGIGYTVTFDDTSGLPLTMAVPSVPLNVSFSDWIYPGNIE